MNRLGSLRCSFISVFFLEFCSRNNKKKKTKQRRMEFGNRFSVLVLLCFLFDRPCAIVAGFNDKHKTKREKETRKKKNMTFDWGRDGSARSVSRCDLPFLFCFVLFCFVAGNRRGKGKKKVVEC